MAVDIGPKIGIDGEKEFRKTLGDINQSIRTLGSEMAKASAEFQNSGDQEKHTADMTKLLNQSIDEQKRKVEMLREAMQKSAEKYGENDKNTLKWRQALADAERELSNTEFALKKTTGQLDKFGDEMAGAEKKGSTFGETLKAKLTGDAIVGGIKMLASAAKEAAKAIGQMFSESVQAADDILTLSTTTGLTTDQIQEFQYMADLTDTSLDTITGSMAKLTKNMDAARGGTGSAAEAFKKLGVSITNEDGSLRSNNEVFGEVLDKLGQLPAETERDALSMDLFGKSAMDLNPLIATGADGIAAFADEAHKMGYVMDTETLGALVNVSDASARLKNTMDTVKRKISGELAPVVADIAEKFLQWAEGVDWEKVGATIKRVVEGVGDAFKVVSEVVKGVIGFVKDLYHFLTVELPQGVANFVNSIPVLGSITKKLGLGAGAAGGGSVVNFTQINNSPKELNRAEIYRQTKNAFATMR